MGYTHYYYRTEVEHDEDTFAKFVADVKKAYKHLPATTDSSGGYYKDSPLKIAGGNGTGKPTFNDDEICFNGSKKSDLWHETLYIPRVFKFEVGDYGKYQRERFGRDKVIFSFCKTARKPYDLLVQVVLILYKQHFGDLVLVASDGNAGEWETALKFVRDVFGTNHAFEDIQNSGSSVIAISPFV